jgi:hypothetical protein
MVNANETITLRSDVAHRRCSSDDVTMRIAEVIVAVVKRSGAALLIQ